MIRISRGALLAMALFAAPAASRAQAAGEPELRMASSGVYTADQAQRGKTVYRRTCAACHASGFFSGEPFRMIWQGQAASAFFDIVQRTMPYDNPGSLKAGQYAAVLAYILELNGYPAGEDVLPGSVDALSNVILDDPPGAGR